MSKFLTKFLVAFLQTFAFCVCQHPEFGNELSNGEQRYFQPKSNHLIQHDARLRRTKFYDTHKHYTIYYIPKTPKIITKLKDMKVLRDQQAIFICSSVGNPPPIIDWQVDEKRELPKRYTVEKAPPRKSILRLDPVSVSDDRSRITCRASNGMGTVFSYASIRVYKKKEEIPPGFPFLVSRSSVIVNEKNSRVLLECQVNGNPKPEILWLKDNIPLDLENPRIKLLKNGGLEINRTLEEDEGGYQCLASNYHGTIISSVIRLMIRENIEDTYQLIMKNVSYFAPQFVSVPNDQVVSPGSSLTLKCRALGNPMPSVFWKCGQTILQPHSYNSSLQKAEANVILSDLSESITCTCIAKNPKESISRSIQVTIQEPSVTPPNIKVSQITATSCVVSWNQKAFREDQLKYQVFIMKTSDLQSGKNIKSNVILYSKRKDSEMNINQKIDNLLPYTNYTGWLEFYNHQGEAVKSNLVTFTTLELPPSSAPRNVELSAISNGALIVTWDPPEIPNGIITSYSIYYTQYRTISLSLWDKYNVKVISSHTPKQQTILSHLLNNVTYYVSISAHNGAGSGPVSELQAILVRAGVVQGPKNLRAIAKSSTEIQLFWDPIVSKPHTNILNYQLMYRPKSALNERIHRTWTYSPNKNSILVDNLKQNTTYEFHLSADTASASGMASIVECTTSNRVNCPSNLNNWKSSISQTGGIKVCWYGIKDKSLLSQIIISFQSKSKRFLTKLNAENFNESICHHQIIMIRPNVKYIVSWSVKNSNCNSKNSSSVITKYKSFEEPINIIVQVLNSTTVDVLWKTTPEMRKQVIHYRIQCRSLVSNEVMVDVFVKNSTITMKHQTEFAHHMFTHLTPNTQYQIYLNTITRHGSGSIFKSDLFKTWPKKLPKPDYLHLRLACSIEHPCVKLEWKTDLKDEKNIKGYRIRYYPLIENADMKFKVVEKNVTVTKFETSSLNYYQGFRFEFKVAAFNEYEVGEESSDQIYILEGTPLVSPTGFKLKSTSQNSPTSISFIWDKLPQHALNGRFDHYQLMCFIVGQENQTRTFYKTKTESITVNNLLENANYACKVRVWIQKSSGLWSDPISFKTKDAHLLPPEAIRFIRLSHSTGLITWKWKLDFPLYYSHFIIYYANEKNNSNQKIWLVETTKSAFTKYMLTSLNATISYVLRVSSVSNRGIEGPQSGIVKEVSLTPKSWEAKFVNQFSCAADSSSSIQLRWSADFNNQELTHFRINFTGVTTFQMETKTVSKMRDEQEQSALVSDQNKYYTHQILNLKPNTMYSIDIEPIFSSTSTMIGTRNHTICTTFKGIPGVIEIPVLSNIDKSTNQIELLLQRPNMENGTIDVFFVLIKIEERLLKNRRKRAVDEFLFEDVMKDNLYNEMNRTNIYAALSLKNDVIFPLSTPNKVYHKILIGSGETKGSFQNRKLQPTLYYSVRVMACIVIRESTFKKLQCQSSPWSNQINIKTTIPPKRNENPLLKSKSKNSYKHSSKDPGAFTTATVVVLLGVVILSVLGMLICLFVKRRKSLRSKLGNSYGSHSNRLCKEKSICMEHLLKEPLVDSAFRISTSGSLRFKNHTNNYLDLNKIQLSSTPDLLVRSSVTQPHSSLVQFHGQHLTNRHFDYAPIPIDALTEHVKLLKENEGRLFNKEYESIEPGQQFTWNNSNVEVNRLKNRYANVIAYDHSRVVLQPLLAQKNSTETSVILGSDYINANYISGYLNPNSYIATQGPLAETIGDFWRMMWEQNSSVIVMMTRLEERDRTKCDQYWPIGGKGSIATYSYVNVTIVDITELAYYTIRRFHIQKANENSNVREVYQLQFTAWPDHGVPNHPAPLLMFLRRVHSEIRRNSGPIVVHCSAGVGRTGAFIVIDYMLERLRYENTIDVYNYVTTIRAQRNYMVQTEDQYIFIYETLLEAVQCGNTEVPVSELPHHIEKLNQIEITHKTVDGIQMTGLQMEFENLILSSEGFLQGIKFNNNNNNNNNSHCSTPSTSHGNVVMNYQPLTYETATQIVNQAKNRIMQILPPDFSRVNICPIRGVEGSDYINASWIDGYKSRKAYIAAQSPLQETCEDFWRTMWEHNSSIIVMLTHLKENNRERCYQYWPNLKSSRYQFFIVDPIAEYNMTTYLIREFKLTDTRDSQSKVIRQFQFTEWQDSESIPLSTQVFLDLIYQVHKTKVQLGQDGPITVHCSAGTGRTGIFLALSNIIERMTNESVIDLFQTVKLLRWQRPALIQTEDQYHFCYVAALEYLKIFEQMRFDL